MCWRNHRGDLLITVLVKQYQNEKTVSSSLLLVYKNTKYRKRKNTMCNIVFTQCVGGTTGVISLSLYW